jgi:hypothetical protein
MSNFELNCFAVCDSCVFPFIYNGTTYDTCVDDYATYAYYDNDNDNTNDDSTQLWCPTFTDVNQNTVEGHWTNCYGNLC